MGYALEIFKAFLGTFTGALLAFLAFWLRERADRRRMAKEWFLNTFLLEAIEPLIHKSRHFVTSAALDHEAMPDTFDQKTYSQVMRVGELLRDDDFVNLWSFAASRARVGDSKVAGILFQNLSRLLLALQDAVLQAKVSKRTSILTLRETAPFQNVKKQLEQLDKALVEGLTMLDYLKENLPPAKRLELEEKLSTAPDDKTKGEIARDYFQELQR